MKTYSIIGRDGELSWGIDYYDAAGKRQRRIVADNEELASDIGAKIQLELREGVYFDRKATGRATLGEAIEVYKVHARGIDSFATELGHLRAIESFWPAGTLLSSIDEGSVEAFRDVRLDVPSKRGGKKNPSKKRSPSTINRELECLRRVLYFAIKKKMLRGENPVTAEVLSIEPKGKIMYLTHEEAAALVAAAREHASWRRRVKKNVHLPGIILTALYTGMRLTTVLNLRWADVDSHKRNLYLPDTKSGQSQNVPMAAILMEELKRIPRTLGSPYVFSKRDGEAFKRISKSFNHARARAGLPKSFTFHGLRHTFVTWSLAGGWPIHVVAKIVGHSTTRMTEIYGHLLPDAGHAVVDSLPDLGGEVAAGAVSGVAAR
jgi:integrase